MDKITKTDIYIESTKEVIFLFMRELARSIAKEYNKYYFGSGWKTNILTKRRVYLIYKLAEQSMIGNAIQDAESLSDNKLIKIKKTL
jgi:hypothetical protein